jgi:hypothetical protein
MCCFLTCCCPFAWTFRAPAEEPECTDDEIRSRRVPARSLMGRTGRGQRAEALRWSWCWDKKEEGPTRSVLYARNGRFSHRHRWRGAIGIKLPHKRGFATPLGVHPSPGASHAACARGDHAAARLVAARPFGRGYNVHASAPPATSFHPCPAMSQSTPPTSSTHSGLPSLAPSRKPRYT